MPGKKIFMIGMVLLALCACQAEPETITIIETVVEEVTVEVPQTVEVTRQVEVELEVTREVVVNQEVTVEVTRIVEVEITTTPTPTPEPTETPTPAPTAAASSGPAEPPPPSDVATTLLQTSINLRAELYRFRDEGIEVGDCYVIVESDNYFNSRPGFDVTGTSNEVQTAYALYQEAVAVAKDATLGISQGCRQAIENQQGFTITYLNYLDIKGKADTAIGKLDAGIGILESLPAE